MVTEATPAIHALIEGLNDEAAAALPGTLEDGSRFRRHLSPAVDDEPITGAERAALRAVEGDLASGRLVKAG